MKLKSFTFLSLFILSNLSLMAQNNYEVLLHTGKQEFAENARDYAETATISAQETIDGQYYRLLQFYQLPTQAGFDVLENAGIELLEYIPNKTYLASIPSSFDLEKLVDLNVRSIVELNADLKLHDGLKRDVFPNWATHRNQVEVLIKYHKNLRHDDILAYCASDNIQVLLENGFNNFLRASIAQDEITAIAALPYVAFLELRPAPDVKDDTEGRSLHRANAIDTNFPSGRSYTGEGIAVLTRDDGAVGPHIDFTGRIFQDESNGFGGDHGDGVSGIFAGAGNLDPRNRGMAAGADLYVINYESSFLDNTMDLFFNNDVIVTNSSYSNGCNAGYSEITETVDQQVFDNPTLLHVFSAGNSNGSDCDYGAGDQWGNITGGHKQGKNVIATANLNNNATLANSSSRGPAHDGRIKPDIAANGANHISTDPDNTYAPFGGTSGAAPGIAGITAMLHHAYAELNGGETANSALLKAILLNTANDLGTIGPDYRFGWGHVNAYRAALTLEDNRYSNHTIEMGTPNTHTVDIPEGVAQARVMVYWADQAGTVMTTKALVNDLNISLSGIDGSVNMPWILDPTPNPTTLALPATTGVDDLNNVEQVALEFPEAGAYTLTVDGFELPFGAHDYYLIWEFRMENEITVIYPIGGEKLVPGETERIHWDTEGTIGTFDLEYSVDNGVSWTAINTIGGDERMYNWVVPTELTADAKVRVRRGMLASDDSDVIFSIASMPSDLEAIQVCPDYIRLTWAAVPDATNYDVYILGEKYMEIVANATAVIADIPITDPFAQYWVAVSANFDNGAKSRRTNAVQVGGELTSCNQENDLRLTAIVSPMGGGGLVCADDFSGNVQVTFVNNGLLAQDNISLGYQFNDNPVVVEALMGTVEPGELVQFDFQTPFMFTDAGAYALKTWVSTPGETSPLDDTLQVNIPVFIGGGAEPEVVEDFQGPDFPKLFWEIGNPDEGITWQKNSVTGITGNLTEVVYMNFYGYPATEELDYFVLEPLGFTNSGSDLKLTFDIAYTYYQAGFEDGLRIELSTDCGETWDNTLYEKDAIELATVPAQLGTFTPASADEWRTDSVDLSPYIGMDKIRIRFVAVNDYGNNLYIDNINVAEGAIVAPIANFEFSPTLLCRNQPVTFTSTSDFASTYTWSFGSGAIPLNATGEGPYEVNYPLQGGDKMIQLIVNNAAGADTMTTQVFVDAIPTGNFDSEVGNDGEVNFISTANNANLIAWDFGNGQVSADQNPMTQYAEPGTYEVTLTLTNDCGDRVITEEVVVMTTSATEVLNNMNLRIFPNPSNGQFALLIENANANQLTLELSDLRGSLIQTVELNNLSGTIQHDFNKQELTSGVYFLKIKEDNKSVVTKVIIE
jgi:PKD repeat protein